MSTKPIGIFEPLNLYSYFTNAESFGHTVDREIFAVKTFSPVAAAAKIKRTKIFLYQIIRARLWGVIPKWRKLNARRFNARKKEYAKISRSTVHHEYIHDIYMDRQTDRQTDRQDIR